MVTEIPWILCPGETPPHQGPSCHRAALFIRKHWRSCSWTKICLSVASTLWSHWRRLKCLCSHFWCRTWCLRNLQGQCSWFLRPFLTRQGLPTGQDFRGAARVTVSLKEGHIALSAAEWWPYTACTEGKPCSTQFTRLHSGHRSLWADEFPRAVNRKAHCGAEHTDGRVVHSGPWDRGSCTRDPPGHRSTALFLWPFPRILRNKSVISKYSASPSSACRVSNSFNLRGLATPESVVGRAEMGTPLVAGIWGGVLSLGTLPLTWGVCSDSRELPSGLNWSVGHPAEVRKSHQNTEVSLAFGQRGSSAFARGTECLSQWLLGRTKARQ